MMRAARSILREALPGVEGTDPFEDAELQGAKQASDNHGGIRADNPARRRVHQREPSFISFDAKAR